MSGLVTSLELVAPAVASKKAVPPQNLKSALLKYCHPGRISLLSLPVIETTRKATARELSGFFPFWIPPDRSK